MSWSFCLQHLKQTKHIEVKRKTLFVMKKRLQFIFVREIWFSVDKNCWNLLKNITSHWINKRISFGNESLCKRISETWHLESKQSARSRDQDNSMWPQCSAWYTVRPIEHWSTWHVYMVRRVTVPLCSCIEENHDTSLRFPPGFIYAQRYNLFARVFSANEHYKMFVTGFCVTDRMAVCHFLLKM